MNLLMLTPTGFLKLKEPLETQVKLCGPETIAIKIILGKNGYATKEERSQ